jgi:DNA invertase Pin-like site-specific DNA recombinase
VAAREGFEAGEVFADEGESAKTIDGRPAFIRLLEFIKKHRPPAVLVWKIDRFARNNLDAQIVRSKIAAQ